MKQIMKKNYKYPNDSEVIYERQLLAKKKNTYFYVLIVQLRKIPRT